MAVTVTNLRIGQQLANRDPNADSNTTTAYIPGAYYAAWDVDKKYKAQVDHYEVIWWYRTVQSIWFEDSSSDVHLPSSNYNAPDTAYGIQVRVKPVSRTYQKDGNEVSYWTGGTKFKEFTILNSAPLAVSTPTVEVKDGKIICTVDNITDKRCNYVRFDIKNGNSGYFLDNVKVEKWRAVCSHASSPGKEWRVRACAIKITDNHERPLSNDKNVLKSSWSDFSTPIITEPLQPGGFIQDKCKVIEVTDSGGSVKLSWNGSSTASTYEIRYSKNKSYLYSASGEYESVETESNKTYYTITGIDAGATYYFALRAKNDSGYSNWASNVIERTIGKTPSAPTTWSSATKVVTGETLTFYWTHNSEDGSEESSAKVTMTIGETVKEVTVTNSNFGKNNGKTYTGSYSVNTSQYKNGSTIKWSVRTAGALTNDYSSSSITRVVYIYDEPTLGLTVTNQNGDSIETSTDNIVTGFPLNISCTTDSSSQKPVSYSLSITTNSAYETTDDIGEVKRYNEGDVIFSQSYDIKTNLSVALTAADVTFEDGIEYTLSCIVAMNSGLTASNSMIFKVSIDDDTVNPDAELSYEESTYTMYITPYVLENVETTTTETTETTDATEETTEEVEPEYSPDYLLYVYRRQYDGSFIEIEGDIDSDTRTDDYTTNRKPPTIVDPHPSLDYARYRIVAKHKTTGAISYSDTGSYPVKGDSIVIQWGETWNSFSVNDGSEEELAQSPWQGGILKLPYNVDVTYTNAHDVSLVKYAGRDNPVSYYGTQKGDTATWNTDIAATDTERLAALRRLEAWMGDAYIREPSGIGYWASIKISYNLKHDSLKIPITFTITRVEGGV